MQTQDRINETFMAMMESPRRANLADLARVLREETRDVDPPENRPCPKCSLGVLRPVGIARQRIENGTIFFRSRLECDECGYREIGTEEGA